MVNTSGSRQGRPCGRQGSVNAGRTGSLRVWNGGVSDLIYILLTLVCFAGLALLVGLIDRRLGSAATDPGFVQVADQETVPSADAGCAR